MAERGGRACSKCGALMDEGFILDNTYGARVQIEWVRGAPELSRLTGVKLKGKEHLPVTTFRCQACGYLESYTSTA